LAFGRKDSGLASRFSLYWQFSRLKTNDDHQSFVGIAPVGARAVRNYRGFVDTVPQPPGNGATGLVV